MAQVRWYLNNSTLDGWSLVDQTAAAAATIASGWVVGTGATFSSEWNSGAAGDRASTTFTANTVPDGTLDTTLKDAFRSQFPQTGSFAAGNWSFQFAVVSTVQSGAADGQIVFRILKADANGANATEITSAQQSTTVATNVAGTDVNITATVSLGAFTITNQYLFIQLAWKRTGAGGMTTTNIRLRTGSSSTVGTTGLTADFTPLITGAGALASTFTPHVPTVHPTQLVTGSHVASTVTIDTTYDLSPIVNDSTETFSGSSTSSGYQVGQSTTDLEGVVQYVGFKLKRIGTDASTLNLEIRENTYDGTVRSVSTVEITFAEIVLDDQFWWVWFEMPAYTFVKGTTYVMCLTRTGATSGTLLWEKTSNLYANGTVILSGGTVESTRDLKFEVDFLPIPVSSNTDSNTTVVTTDVQGVIVAQSLYNLSGSLLYVNLWLSRNTGVETDILHVYVRQGSMTGPIIDTSRGYNINTRLNTTPAWLGFLFEPAIVLDPSQVYVIQLVRSGGASVVDLYVGYVAANSYVNGVMYATDGVDVLELPAWDLKFKLEGPYNGWLVNPPPAPAPETPSLGSTFTAHAPEVVPEMSAINQFLVACWELEEGSNVTAIDAHGNTDLAATGTTSVTGKIGLARKMVTGTPSFLGVADTAALALGSDTHFGAMFWIKTGVMAGVSLPLMIKSRNYGSYETEYYFRYDDSNVRFNVYLNNANIAAYNVALSPATDYFVAFWHDPAADKIYIQLNNATPHETAHSAGTTYYSGSEFRIGAVPGSGVYVDTTFDQICFFKGGFPDASLRTWMWNSGNGRSYADMVAQGGPTDEDITAGTCASTFAPTVPTAIPAAVTVTASNVASTFSLNVPVVARANEITLIASGGAIALDAVTATVTLNTLGADFIIIHVSSYTAAASRVFTDSKGNTWSPLNGYGAGAGESKMYYCFNPTTDAAHSFSVTASGTPTPYPSMQAMAWSGMGAFTADQQVGVAGTATTISPGSITPPANGAMFFTGTSTSEAGIRSIDAGFTKQIENSYVGGTAFGGVFAYLQQVTAAAVAPTWSWGGSNSNVSSGMVTFVPGAGAGPQSVTTSHLGSTFSAAASVVSGGALIASALASTFVANGPTVRLNLLASMIGHWPCYEDGSIDYNINNVHGAEDLLYNGIAYGQDPIDGTPARIVKPSGGVVFNEIYTTVGASGDLAFSSDQAFTFVVRTKLYSDSAGSFFLIAKPGDCSLYYYSGGFGFGVTDSSGVTHDAITPGPSNDWLSLTDDLGATFVIACGYDPATDKVWIRVNNDARVETTHTTGTRNTPGELVFGGSSSNAGIDSGNMDGAIGPISFWKRSLSDGELDAWISAKGDYGALGGEPYVLAARRASTFQAFAPSVAHAVNFTTDLAGHWNFDESSSSADAVDQHGAADLTLRVGTSAQAPIDSTPARDFELDTGTAFVSAVDAITFASDQSFTFAIRLKLESISSTLEYIAGKRGISSEFSVYWWASSGFRFQIGGADVIADPTTTSPTLGATYVVACGHDGPGNKIWIRVNGGTRYEATWSGGLTPIASTRFIIGDNSDTATTGYTLDGSAGPASLWKRVVSDAELDAWITAKGDYDTLVGGPPDQNVTTTHLASTFTLRAPKVITQRNLSTNFVGHWPFAETTSSAAAEDIIGTVDLAATDSTSAQDPIDGTPARDFNGTVRFDSGNAVSFALDQEFTYAWRFKTDALGDNTIRGVTQRENGAFNGVVLQLYWTPAGGFTLELFDETHAGFYAQYAGPSNEWASSLPAGTYTIIGGFSTSTGKGWLRVGYGPRVETASGAGVAGGFGAQQLVVGDGPSQSPFTLVGAGGPLSYWTRSLTDEEVDWWVFAKGDYSSITGSAQSINGVHVASTLALNVPTVVVGPVPVTAGTVVSTFTPRTHTITTGPVAITGSTVTTTFTPRTHTIAAGPVAVTVGTAVSTFTPRIPSVAVGPVGVGGSTVATTFAVTEPAVTNAGAVSVGTAASTFTTNAPTLIYTLVTAFLGSTFTPNAPTVQQRVTVPILATSFAAFVLSVAATYALSTPVLASTMAVRQPAVTVGPVGVTTPALTSTFNTFSLSVVASGALATGTADSTFNATGPSVTTGPVSVTTPAHASTMQVRAPSVQFVIGGAHCASTFTALAPSAAFRITTAATLPSTFSALAPSLAGALVTGTATTTFTPRTHTITTGAVSVTIGTAASTFAFGPPTATGDGVLAFPAVASTFAFGPPSLTTGPVSLTTGVLPTSFAARQPSVAYGVSGASLASTMAVRSPAKVLVDFAVAAATVPSTFAATPSSVLGVSFVSSGTRASTFTVFSPAVTYQTQDPHVASTFAAYGPALTTGAVPVVAQFVASTFTPHVLYVIRASDAVEPDRLTTAHCAIRRTVTATMFIRRTMTTNTAIRTDVSIGKGER